MMISIFESARYNQPSFACFFLILYRDLFVQMTLNFVYDITFFVAD